MRDSPIFLPAAVLSTVWPATHRRVRMSSLLFLLQNSALKTTTNGLDVFDTLPTCMKEEKQAGAELSQAQDT